MLRTSKSLLLAIMVLMLLACAPAAVCQTSVVKYTLDTPVSNQTVTGCNNDNVSLNGTMHFEYFFSTDPDGNTIHYHISSSSHLTGTSSGINYVASENVHQDTITHGGQASDVTMSMKSKLVAQGPTPNMMLIQNLHVITDKNGNIKAQVLKYEMKCN